MSGSSGRAGAFMPAPTGRTHMPGRPLDVLEETLGDRVTVQLKGGEV